MLASIRSPEDIRGLSYDELLTLAGEIREEILRTVSHSGGHLASNLGTVELTLALHRMFRTPEDTLLFDVGHQCYTHKLLTGRYDRFSALRQFGGLSGFTSRGESPYDTVSAGHSGSSLSIALGMAEADRAAGRERWTVCVIGDGAFTNGMIYEALNNCLRSRDLRLLIVLNDNEMSISKNVGGLSDYLTEVRTSPRYFAFKRRLEKGLERIPGIGGGLASFARRIKEWLKKVLGQDTLFDALGIPYVGTVDGGDLARLEEVLTAAKARGKLCLVHVLTHKGAGYADAEAHPDVYHSVSPFDPAVGVQPRKADGDFSSVFGETVTALAEKDARVSAVTAAMRDGTGLASFAKRFPERFYDVGIAEEHAVSFAAGLSLSGQRPVCALYATFAQRVYDQVFHDVALQNIPFVLALDRAGLVPGDGKTHQGLYDVAMLSSVPGIRIISPETADEVRFALTEAVGSDTATVVRYPKGTPRAGDRSDFTDLDTVQYAGPENADVAVVTYGRLTENVSEARKLLPDVSVRIVKLVTVCPLDRAAIRRAIGGAGRLLLVEEGIRAGGVMERLAAGLAEDGVTVPLAIRAVEDRFVPAGTVQELEELLGFSPRAIAEAVLRLMGKDKGHDGSK